MNKIVIAFDPGGTTGYCVGEYHTEVIGLFAVRESGAIGWSSVCSRIYELLSAWRPAVIVTERFVLYKHKASDQIGSDFPSSQVIGIIKAYSSSLGLPAQIFQNASVANGKPQVRILPEHEPLLQTSEHARDAYRHLRYWITQDQTDTRKLADWRPL